MKVFQGGSWVVGSDHCCTVYMPTVVEGIVLVITNKYISDSTDACGVPYMLKF